MIAVYILLAAFVLLLIVLIARAAAFKPAKEPAAQVTQEEFDREQAVENFREVLRCKTVSYKDKSLEDGAEFDKLYEKLPTLYPNVYKTCVLTQLNDRSLLYHWKGKSSDRPGVLMAHFDVVPVNEDAWEKPAFEAIIENGVLWGRGTLDTKGTFAGVMQAADNLMAQGFVPEHDLYLAFAGDEEVMGHGATAIVQYFKERGIRPEFVLDEGGAVVRNVFPGVSEACAVVGIAEKGPMDVTFTLNSTGGHASTPPPHTSVGVLAQAVARVESHPFPFHLTAPAAQMFDTLGRRSTFVYRLIFANLWLFRPVLDLICKKSGGELNALVRTTVAFTQMQGSAASNVLPPNAWVGANLRLMSGETVQSAKAYLEKVVSDDRIRVDVVSGMNPSPVSRTDDEPWQRLKTAISATWTDTVVSPYLMLACSDSRHYGEISDHVYRFSAMGLSKEERGMIHANNERIPLETFHTTVAFYQRLIRAC